MSGEVVQNESLAVLKPMLDTAEMIEHLKTKGVQFQIDSEEAAYRFLEEHNNYFKLTAYRKNFDVKPSNNQKGPYINLDFAALRELSTLDMHLRYILIHMSLDIEHMIKVDLIKTVQKHNKADAYQIVEDYFSEYNSWKMRAPDDTQYRDEILKVPEGDVYRSGLIEKYQQECPIWALAEIVQLGELIRLYMYAQCHYVCASCNSRTSIERTQTCERVQNGELTTYKVFSLANTRNNSRIEMCPRIRQIEQTDRILQEVRRIRNGAAHNSCILNDLRIPRGNSNDDTIAPLLENELRNIMPELQKRIPSLNFKSVKQLLKNPRIRQCMSLLCAHREFVCSPGMMNHRWKELRDFADKRLLKNKEYYSGCRRIVNFFEFLQATIDIWSESCYNNCQTEKTGSSLAGM